MKKMMFLMLALLFWCTASMNAQVRIGGTNGPHDSAVLDLNPNEGDATRGLALPRVVLNSTGQTLNGVEPQLGTVVYNTGSEKFAAGSYVWSSLPDGTTDAWIPVGKINTVESDSNYILRSDGVNAYWSSQVLTGSVSEKKLVNESLNIPINWTEVFKARIDTEIKPGTFKLFSTDTEFWWSTCIVEGSQFVAITRTGYKEVRIWNIGQSVQWASTIRCYSPI